MKKTLSIVLASALLGLTSVLSLTGCGSSKNQVIIYTAAEEERIEYLQTELNKQFPSYEIVFQSLGTGTLVSKLQAEGKSTDCDIFYDLEATNAEIIINGNSDLFYDLGNDYDFSIYDDSVLGYTSRHHKYAVNGKTDYALLTSDSSMDTATTTYNDLLDSKYSGSISMPSPKSSGTGYSFYAGVVDLLGETEGLNYFASLNSNIKEYTTSGSAPAKAVVRGEVTVGVGLLWQCVNYANENSNLKVVIPEGKTTFNLFTMGMINGHESKQAVKDVFTYLYNGLNEEQCVRYNPDKIYKNQGAAQIANYPTNFTEFTMEHLFDAEYKQNLLDKWQY